jgi:hypothetical protein
MISPRQKAAFTVAGTLFVGGAIALTMGCVLAITPLIIAGVIVLMAGSMTGMLSCMNSRY